MKIQIIGTTGEGKSAIANLMFDLLKSHGFIVDLQNEEEMGDYTPHLRSLKEQGIGIEIETVQSNKSGYIIIKNSTFNTDVS